MNRRVFVVVPARSGSKGIPHKNLADLHGKPLIAWSIAASLKLRAGVTTLLLTDSEDYAEIGRRYGATVPYIRSKATSGDKATDREVFLELLANYPALDDADILVQLRPTTPLRMPSKIDEAIELFLSYGEDITSLRSVHEMQESAYKTLELDALGMLKPIRSELVPNLEYTNRPRQSFPSTYVGNGYVDILRVGVVRRFENMHGDRCYGFKVPTTIEIDGQYDLDLARHLVSVKPDMIREIFES